MQGPRAVVRGGSIDQAKDIGTGVRAIRAVMRSREGDEWRLVTKGQGEQQANDARTVMRPA